MTLLVRLLNGVAAVLGVAVVAVVAAALMVDPNDYRDRIVAAVQDATGRTLTLGGTLTLTRSLWPTLEASDVSLSNVTGGSRPQMVHVERIEGQLALLSLLRHEVEITRLSLIGPNILFETVAGVPNWVFVPGDAGGPGVSGTSEVSFSLRVRGAHVTNGMVTWRLPARTKVVGIRSLDFMRSREGGPINARSTLVYADNQPFALDVAAEPTGGLMDPWQTRLQFAAFDAHGTATGRLAIAGAYDMQIEAAAGAVEKLNALLPEMGLPALHQASLSAHLVNGRRPGDLPVVGPASLRFASADLRDRVPGLVLAATRATLPSSGGQAAVDSTGRYAGTGFHLAGNFGVPEHPDGKASLPLGLSVTAADSALTVKGMMAVDTLQFGGLEAAVTLRVKALAGLRPILGDGLPALEDVDFSGDVAVPGGPGPVRLRAVTLQTSQGDVTGEGSVEAKDALVVSGRWRSQSLDLDRVLAAFGVDLTGSGAPRRRTGPVIPDTALPWGALRGPTLDLGLVVGAMQFQGEVWRDVQAAVALKAGRLVAGPISVEMPRSRMQATARVDAGQVGAPVSVSVTAPALPLALVARYFDVPGSVVGTADLSVQWQARGGTMRALAGSLEGPFSITAVKGQLTNRALIGLTGAALSALGITVPAEGETRLDCLGLAGSFAAGVGTLRTIALQTNYLSLQGAGQVDLGRETVALKLQPMARVAGSPVSVPVVVQGPFRDVSGMLDAGGLEKLGFFVDGLFGGDTVDVCKGAGLGR